MRTSPHEAIREFNRFYTSIIGLLDNHILDSRFSLAEARTLFEIAHNATCTASDLIASLKMDKGQLSRILDSFKKKGLVVRRKSKEDGRSSHLSLTARGEQEFSKLNKTSNEQIKSLIKNLSIEDQNNLLFHMDEIRKTLSATL